MNEPLFGLRPNRPHSTGANIVSCGYLEVNMMEDEKELERYSKLLEADLERDPIDNLDEIDF